MWHCESLEWLQLWGFSSRSVPLHLDSIPGCTTLTPPCTQWLGTDSPGPCVGGKQEWYKSWSYACHLQEFSCWRSNMIEAIESIWINWIHLESSISQLSIRAALRLKESAMRWARSVAPPWRISGGPRLQLGRKMAKVFKMLRQSQLLA